MFNPELKSEQGESAEQEVVQEEPTEKPLERKPENKEATAEELRALREGLDLKYEEKPEELEDTPEDVWRRVVKYQERYLPDYLKEKPGVISKAIGFVLRTLETIKTKPEIEGKENIPEGECLVVCNHFGGGGMGMGDTESIMSTFKEKNIHVGIGKNIWWDKSPLLRWVFKKMGGIPIDESLANLTEEQKQEVLERQTEKAKKKIYGGIIEREKKGRPATNIDFVRQSVAALSRGDAVSVYPEGLWLNPEGPFREKQELKQGYRGIELVAREYKKVTGKELKIVPTTFIEDRKTGNRKFVIGEPLELEDNNTELNDTDWVMTHVAKMLPQEQRGYYKDMEI